MSLLTYCSLFFFFNDTATTEIYTLSLHDALPICSRPAGCGRPSRGRARCSAATASCSTTTSPGSSPTPRRCTPTRRSEEHTSELQSRQYIVCRLLLEKKKKVHRCKPFE